MPLITTKVCTGKNSCGMEKPLSEFYPKARGRTGYNNLCKQCEIRRVGIYNRAHTEERAVYKYEWYMEHRDEQYAARRAALEADPEAHETYKAYMRQYYQEHREEHRERMAKWKAENPDVVLELEARYRENNRDEIRLRQKQWIANNPERSQQLSLMSARRRIARKKKLEGWHTIEEWLELCAYYDHICLRCGKKAPLTADHIIPVSKNGPDWVTNIQPLCKPCNSSKGTKCTDYRPDRK